MSLENPQNPSALARAVVNVPSGTRVLRDRDNRVCVTTATCTGEIEAHDIFSQKLDSGDGWERPRGAGSEAPFVCAEGPRVSTELLDCGAWPSRGLPFA